MSVKELLDDLPYGPAPESAELAVSWLEAHDRRFGLFIGGEFRPPAATFPVYNPATGDEIAQVTQASVEDVDQAVQAAKEGQKRWLAFDAFQRAKVLYAISRAIQRHSRLFAVLETLDNGKPIRETRDLDIPLVARHFLYHAGWVQSLAADQPVGVCGQIIPWNFPLLMLAWKIAPALAAGNSVVLKPAEYTPLTALLFAEICGKAGLPAGVVNIVTGDGETGKALVRHPEVKKVAFTGSTEVGRWIRKETAGSGKKLSLELGGKSPFVVYEDADLDSAVEGLVDAIWFNQGQVCCAGSRLLVQESIEKRFLEKVKARMSTLRVGDPLDKAIDIGAIVAPVQLDRIRELVGKGVEEGADLFQPEAACPAKGWFYPPTLLTNVAPASTVAQLEIFGPVLVAMSFRTPAEAVALANNTTYGLAASVWSQNLDVALDAASKVKAGTVWVNCTNMFDASSGFGGYRESGYGREGGREGLAEYLSGPAKEMTSFGPHPASDPSPIDRTHKQYVGGKQVRPDGGSSFSAAGEEFAQGNRKDVRNAVEAARAAQSGWAGSTAHLRSQILYYLAENLASELPPSEELDATVRTVFEIAGLADKQDGQVHMAPIRALVYTNNEPIGVVGIVCPDDSPLYSLVVPCAGAIAMGNTVVVVASEADPRSAALLYRVLEMSDVPAGVLNILTGYRNETQPTLADHADVDSIWDFGPTAHDSERRSAGNLKQCWSPKGFDVSDLLRHAVQVKNVWVPYGA